MLERLASLVDHSLLEQRSGSDAPLPRFGMLETIHEFAAERLEEPGEVDFVRAAHARMLLALAEASPGHEITDGREPQQALARLDGEHDNLRAALSWALDDQRDAATREVGCAGLASALWRFWAMRGYLTEGQQWLDRALRAGDDVAPVWRARALNASGNLARWHGEFALAAERHEACLALRRELGDKPGEATSLLNLGNIAFDLGDYARAVELFGSSLALYREVGDDAAAALALNNLGTALREDRPARRSHGAARGKSGAAPSPGRSSGYRPGARQPGPRGAAAWRLEASGAASAREPGPVARAGRSSVAARSRTWPASPRQRVMSSAPSACGVPPTRCAPD